MFTAFTMFTSSLSGEKGLDKARYEAEYRFFELLVNMVNAVNVVNMVNIIKA